jgi:type IV pilus assembly protein PilP
MTGSRPLPSRFARWASFGVLAAMLAACGGDSSDLQAWMEETRRNTAQKVDSVPPPKRFEPFRYAASEQVDPFNLSRMKGVALSAGRVAGTLQPDTNRRREPLEAMPLDSLKMVGNLRQGPNTVALLQAETMLYPVRVGNYVGQNFGQIIRISDNEVAIKELVQDAAGDWVQRDTTLQLQTQEPRR